MADSDRTSGLRQNVLDASVVSPPTLTYETRFTSGELLPPNFPVDLAFIPHFTTNPDFSAWPSGALWPPNPPDPVGSYAVAAPYGSGTFTMAAMAWSVIRPLTQVYGFLLSGPRITLLGNPSYQKLRSVWGILGSTLVPVVHSTPIASAGGSRAWPVDVSAGRLALTTDVVLDGSASFDRDADPLTYSWAVLSGPERLPWQLDQLGRRVATILPAGTEIPATGLGTYSFGLTVRDPYASSTATVQHTLVRLNRAPVAVAVSPQRRHRLAAGLRLREDVVLDASGSSDPDGDPLSYRWELLDDGTGPRCSVYIADRTNPLVRLYAAGERLQIPELSCLGTYAFRVTVADPRGAVNSTDVTQTFEINAPTLEFSSQAPRVVALEALKKTVRFPFDVQAATGPDAVDADAYRLEIRDQAGQRLVSRAVTDSEVTDGITWDGVTGPGYPIRVGLYRLVVIALTEGVELTRTQVINVTVVAIQVTVRGTTRPVFSAPTPPPGPGGPQLPGGGSSAGPTMSRQAFAVTADEPPQMPQLTVTATVVGLPATAPSPTWEMRMVLEDIRQDQSWTVSVPESGWKALSQGQTEWTPTLPFGGGTVTASARCTVDGVTVDGTAEAVPNILGQNPEKTRIRASLPWSLALQIATYDATRFQQFGGGISLFTGSTLARPYLKDGRVGACGIPDGTAAEAWNWVTNIDSARRRVSDILNRVRSYQDNPLGQGGRGPFLKPPLSLQAKRTERSGSA